MYINLIDDGWTALAAITLALLCSQMFVRNLSASKAHEFAALDGLRGFVAFFVFLHHSRFWFNFSHGQAWASSGSPLFVMFGQLSICIFFMLSGFLFTNKLLVSRDKHIDWLGLYVSRFLRLTPLYIFMLVLVLIVVATKTHFVLLESVSLLKSNIQSWLFFTVNGAPDINTLSNTSFIVSGVVWTLPYEWFFYFSLPVIAVFLGVKSKGNSSIWLILSCIFLFEFTRWGLDLTFFLGFLGGGFASVVVNVKKLKAIFSRPEGNWIVLFGVLGCYGAEPSSNYYIRLVLMSVCLAFIACGADIFGLLRSKAARALSLISYGIYLLHGIVLYVMFMLILPVDFRMNMTQTEHWAVVLSCIPIVILIAMLAWYLIELPAINFAPKLTHFFRTQYLRWTNKFAREVK